MLETIRAFCAERLEEAGEDERMRRAHVAYFLELAETADPRLRRAEQLDWLRRLDGDHDNLHAALHRATEAGDVATALRLLSALTCYWWLRGLRSESASLARELLAKIGLEPPDGLTEEYALCVLTIASAGDLPVTARVAEGLAGVAMLEGDGERAALLLGVGAALRGSALAEDPDVARITTRARARIGDAAYDSAYTRGRTVTRERMLTIADASQSALTVIDEHLSALGR